MQYVHVLNKSTYSKIKHNFNAQKKVVYNGFKDTVNLNNTGDQFIRHSFTFSYDVILLTATTCDINESPVVDVLLSYPVKL